MKVKGNCLVRAVLTLGFLASSTTASAIPLRFDFSGTVVNTSIFSPGVFTSDPTNNGAAFSASIIVETDGLTKTTTASPQGTTVSHSDVVAAPELVTSSVVINGVSYDVGVYNYDSGGISFLNSAGPFTPATCPIAPCTGFAADSFRVFDSSSELFASSIVGVPDGTYRTRTLNLSVSDPDSPFSSSNYALGMDYFDLSAIESPLTAVTLAQGFLGGNFQENSLTCTSVPVPRCVPGLSRITVFSITSLTRSIVTVPEPASLGLFAMGLLGLAGLRRRRR